MRRRLRILAFVAGSVAALAVGLAVFLVANFDASRIKAQAVRYVQETQQRTLRLDGDFALSFWPSLAIRVTDAGLSEYKSGAEFASVGEARVAIALLPLLRGEVKIGTIVLRDVKASVVRDKSGTFNFDDLGGKPSAQAPSSPRLDLAGIELENADLSYADRASGRELQISRLNLTTGPLGSSARGNVKLDAAIVSKLPVAQFAVVARSAYAIDEDKFSLHDANAELKGSLPGLSDAKLTLTLSGAKSAERGLALDGLKLNAAGRTAQGKLEAKLDLPHFERAVGGIVPPALNLDARLDGEAARLNLRLALAGAAVASPATAARSVVLAVNATRGADRLVAELASALAVDEAKQIMRLPDLRGKLELASPAMRSGGVRVDVSGAAMAQFAAQSIESNLTARFDASQLDLRFWARNFSAPDVRLDLDADKLDLDAYRIAAAPAGGGQSRSGTATVDKIEFPALDGFTLAGKLHAGQLQVQRIKLADLNAQFKAGAGRLEIAPVTARLYGGKLSARLEADAPRQRAALQQNLSGVDAYALLRDALGREILEGRGDFDMDVSGQGATLGQFKRSLAGSAAIALHRGAVRGIDIAQTLRDIKAKLGLQKAADQAADSRRKTEFASLTASFRIKDGVAHNDDLDLKSPYLRGRGSGDIDLAAQTVDYLVRASVVATSRGEGGKDLAQLAGLTIPIRLTGPFDKLAWHLDLGSALGAGVKEQVERVERAGENLRRQSGENLRRGLENLLKR
ncbi:MAG: AsmA family protein [Rhodocyclaceae bacterium]|nr:AsmA family protein [Rhodocyclaceae bacterium]